MLLDIGLRASPHDLRRGLATMLQKRLRIPRDTVKMILDHNEGIGSDDVLVSHYTEDDWHVVLVSLNRLGSVVGLTGRSAPGPFVGGDGL